MKRTSGHRLGRGCLYGRVLAYVDTAVKSLSMVERSVLSKEDAAQLSSIVEQLRGIEQRLWVAYSEESKP